MSKLTFFCPVEIYNMSPITLPFSHPSNIYSPLKIEQKYIAYLD